ncbi:MAG: formate dehydrogenase accessory sulfurtransferase FdhD [Candidatus Delongbacteria bacterium]|nr:formate dehydrogenase accessory sulfurtransferase FdhD [Candidatus Delongbacteria bacterium]
MDLTRPGRQAKPHESCRVSVRQLTPSGLSAPVGDCLAEEAPLQMRLVALDARGEPQAHPLGITLRTPGKDLELAVGHAWSEGLLRKSSELRETESCARETGHSGELITLFMESSADPDVFARRIEARRRLGASLSSCGLCGSAGMDSLLEELPELPQTTLAADTLLAIARHPLHEVAGFRRTGALHSACLFSADGQLLRVHEDIGRHNALDKLIGSLLLENGERALTDASGGVVLVSGRISWELVQKCLRAGLPCLLARGAPSSMAVELGGRHGMLLAGFLREARLNLYCGSQRLSGVDA